MKGIEVTIKVQLKKGEGKNQDPQAQAEQFVSELEGTISDIWVQDDDHDVETPYEVHDVTLVGQEEVTLKKQG